MEPNVAPTRATDLTAAVISAPSVPSVAQAPPHDAGRDAGRDTLRGNTLLRGIAASVLDAAAIALERATFAAGDVIFEEGSTGDVCYLVESGLVRISKLGRDGSDETLGFIGSGEFFGELATLYGTPRSARATAVSPTTVGMLDGDGLRRLRDAAPLEITAAIADAGLRRLRELHTTLLQQLGDADRFRQMGVGMAKIAHDIRSPLATIQMAADSLVMSVAEGRLDADVVRQHAEMIRRTADQARRTADDILTQLRDGVVREHELCAVRDLAHEAAGQVLGLMRGHRVDFQTHVDDEGTIACERDELVRALANLLRNAVEALPDEGGSVILRASGDGQEVRFTVSDTGRGIPPELHGRIFERRFTSGKAGGTGLGLAQVRQVVERHGGRVAVASEVGEGTTFTLRLPAR